MRGKRPPGVRTCPPVVPPVLTERGFNRTPKGSHEFRTTPNPKRQKKRVVEGDTESPRIDRRDSIRKVFFSITSPALPERNRQIRPRYSAHSGFRFSFPLPTRRLPFPNSPGGETLELGKDGTRGPTWWRGFPRLDTPPVVPPGSPQVVPLSVKTRGKGQSRVRPWYFPVDWVRSLEGSFSLPGLPSQFGVESCLNVSRPVLSRLDGLSVL